MADQFLGEIRLVAMNFPPQGWLVCDGSTLAISSNAALFSLLGTTYGGNGTSTFQLPNLQGNLAMGFGSGPGLSSRILGETGGSSSITLLTTEIPGHSHTLQAKAGPATTGVPSSGVVLAEASKLEGGTRKTLERYAASSPNGTMAAGELHAAGSNQPHNNLQPCQSLLYIIATTGIYPSRG